MTNTNTDNAESGQGEAMKTHHNPLKLVAELQPLLRIFPGKATKKWLSKTAWTIWNLETTGATRFGGPEVFAWWLVQRCQPKATAPRSKALVHRAEDRRKPKRLETGWSFLELNSYLAALSSNTTL